jgi:hypothetical protein
MWLYAGPWTFSCSVAYLYAHVPPPVLSTSDSFGSTAALDDPLAAKDMLRAAC